MSGLQLCSHSLTQPVQAICADCGYSQDKTVVEFRRQLHFSGNLLNRLDKWLAALHGGNTGELFFFFFFFAKNR